MSNKEKIEVAEQRILELKTLINHWKTSNISSRRATVDFVEAVLSNRKGTQAAWFLNLAFNEDLIYFLLVNVLNITKKIMIIKFTV